MCDYLASMTDRYAIACCRNSSCRAPGTYIAYFLQGRWTQCRSITHFWTS
ncbi:MAG: hypothetical protein ACLUDG_00460 [Butyricicoccus sp.]